MTRFIAFRVLACTVGMLTVIPASAQTQDIVLHAAHATTHGDWKPVLDATAASGARLANTDRRAPKLVTALAAPVDYFELQFQASAGVAYRLWLRGQATGDSYLNDSVHLQFSDSVSSTGAPRYRIGTSSSTVYTVEDCSGCYVAGWGWNDNFYGSAPGEFIYFANSGLHTVRVQTREDGIALDQIVLSAVQFKTSAPGTAKRDTVILPEAGLAGETGISTPGEIVLYASTARTFGDWTAVADAGAAGGMRLANNDHGVAKRTTALASPVDYFELDFQATPGVPYRLWMRATAARNFYGNDSVHVQFSDSVTATGVAAYRIGSTASTVFSIEDCNGCGVSGWGWNDNLYGSTAGELIYFATSGPHTVRVQVREDGVSLDQIVLSPVHYRTSSPGAAKNDTTILAAIGGVEPPTAGLPEPPPPVEDPIPEPPPVEEPANLAPVFEADPDGFRIAALHGAMAAPATLLFTASATGPESTDTLTYTWKFGDGTPDVTYLQAAEASRQNAVHTYTQSGTYTATVVVKDQAGNIAKRTSTVVIKAGTAAGASTLKLLQLNSYKGRTSDTRTEQSKVWLQARWMAGSGADVILLQEVMGTNHANKYKAELEALTGVTWSYFFRTDADTTSKTVQGIAIFTRKPILTTASMPYAPCPAAQIKQRAAIAVTIEVNGRNIVVIDTHLSSYSGSADRACRSEQVRQLSAWAANLGPNRIITGDLNADPAEDAIRWLLSTGNSLYNDTWAPPAAGAADRRTSYPDNPVQSMTTRSERIDYVLTSKGAPLDLVAVQVPDTRDYTNDNAIPSQGKTYWSFHNAAPRISDHEMIIATFNVK